MKKINVLEVAGSFYEMGRQHGQAHHDAIHRFTEDRIRLSGTETWTGRTLSEDAILALADACVDAHNDYAPELMQELNGMADAVGLSAAALLVNNGFTDFIDTVYSVGDVRERGNTQMAADNCTAFLIPNGRTADGRGLFGQTWDMHASATPFVMMLRGQPDGYPAFLSFTISGCLGMIGMNDAGIAIGINNLMGRDGQIGVMWPFVVRKALMQTDLDSALACITEAKLAGAHNYLLLDKHGHGYNIEAMATRCDVQPLEAEPLAHTNHCLLDVHRELERERHPDSMKSSVKRLQRAYTLLDGHAITPEVLMDVTRDAEAICVRSAPPYHTESCGAAIMRPATGDFWAVWGLPSENEYEHFRVQ